MALAWQEGLFADGGEPAGADGLDLRGLRRLPLDERSWLDVGRGAYRGHGALFDLLPVNLYRDGRDGVAWHGDTVRKRLDACVVVTLALGERRPFPLPARVAAHRAEGVPGRRPDERDDAALPAPARRDPRHVPSQAMTSARHEALDGVHEAFLAEPDLPLPDLVRPVVADSWRRSLRLGVDPVAHAPIEFAESALAAYREAHPLAPLMPLVRSLLAEDAEDAGHIVAVGDAQGRLLWVEGHHGLRGRAEQMNFVPGALWSERGAGTNAPGTALATRAAVQIAASEHFGLQVHPWSCVAAPVRDPLSGELLGVVDLTGGADLAGPRSLALVRACASAMESQLLAAARERAAWESSRPTVIGVPRPVLAPSPRPAPASLALLGRDGAVLTAEGRTTTLSPRHSELLWLLARHPLGLSGQGIDAALHEAGEHLVTIRAELVRLRRVLAEAFGTEVLASKPYRLTVGVTSDVEDVRRLLGRGAVVKALDAFDGPPLPSSSAPEVVSAREEFVAEVREAVLRSRSVPALERWTATQCGHDDAAAWTLLEQVLPYGSPKRSTAKAHVRRLASA